MTETATAPDNQTRSEVRDGMRIDWDLPIHMDDGLALRADVFRPEGEGGFPVLLTYGPYAKGLAFQEGYPDAWNAMAAGHPDVTAGSTNKYQNWEVVDPEKWVPNGYAVVRVDSRGCGRSPGFVDHFSPRETQDYYDSIEWAGTQPWSNGKVGLSGVSYFGINQWQVASRQPPHLAAMCIWEGAADWYRDMTHHGGILSTFWANWSDMQVKTVQHGLGERGPKSRVTGDLVCGPQTLDEAELAANRCDFGADIRAHPLDDDYHAARSAHWSRITVPFLSAGNWGGQGLHLRGNTEAFVRAASTDKWLEMHGLEHWTEFYTGYGVALQRRFFDRFLKGEANDWPQQPRVQLQVRSQDGFKVRAEDAWPLARTQWTRLHLDAADTSLGGAPIHHAATAVFAADGEGVTFWSQPMAQETEITGPLAAKLSISSGAADADLFLVVRVFDPAGREMVFQGAVDPHTPIAQGWLRASHRKLDDALSQPYRPYHSHDEAWPLEPGQPVEVDIELWPTCIVIPAGYRLALTVRGRDYEHAGAAGARLNNFKNELKGCGAFLHDDPLDRPPSVFGASTTVHTGPDHPAYLLVPVIPDRTEG